jgi:cytochrome c oxidase assembly protein subunit 11
MTRNRRNIVAGWAVAAAICLMVGLSFAAVPLYRVFCAATGYGGTPRIGLAAAPGGNGQTIRVRFNADTNPGLPWNFGPDQSEVSLKLGDEQVAFYHASNQSAHPETGMAVYNVTPEKVGKYFHKTTGKRWRRVRAWSFRSASGSTRPSATIRTPATSR